MNDFAFGIFAGFLIGAGFVSLVSLSLRPYFRDRLARAAEYAVYDLLTYISIDDNPPFWVAKYRTWFKYHSDFHNLDAALRELRRQLY